MVKKRLRNFNAKEAVEFFNHVMQDKPLLPFLIPLGFFAWAIERWLVPFSNWVPLSFAVWATIQYARFERQLLVEDLNRRWKQLIANSSHSTPLEPCEWLNKLLMEIWPNYMEPRISKRFSSLVETRLKHRRPRLIERIELQEFSLGSCPPSLGQNGVHWIASGDQQVMRMGFEWNTNDMSVMLLAKLAKPLRGTARIVINSMFIKGQLRFIPILDGQAVLYSFESTPEVRIGVAFGSGGSQTLPATELPGVSTWLVKLFTETLNKMMVEPRRGCYSLPTVDLRKRAIGGVLSVTVVSASKLGQTSLYNHKQTREGYTTGSNSVGNSGSKMLQTFVEVEIGDLTRRTSISQGLNPRWDASFNMVLHGDSGILKFHLYEWDPNSVKFNYLTSCEIKMKYVADGTTSFWAIGPESSVVAKQAEYCGKEVEMVVPFEETTLGESKTYGLRIRKTLDVLLRTIRDVTEGKDITLKKGWSWICVSQCTSSLTVKLVLKEWQYSDGQISLDTYSNAGSQHSTYSSQLLQLQTGRKIKITVVEGRNLMTKDKSGKCDPYVKILYGKALHRTKTISNATSPVWNQRFEFDEIGGGEYLKIRCYNADRFGDEHIGSARVNLEGLIEGSCKDVWIPLEKVNIGELRLQIELLKSEDPEGSKNSAGKYGNGWIELVVIEARDLIAADLRGTSDPYVRVHYGNSKKRTKVIYKTLNPQWYQTFEFPDIGSPLVLYVKDYNALLPKSSIGDCVVEYDLLPPNQTADKWIPLQGVKNGEIHVQVTRRVPEMRMKMSLDTDASSLTKAQGISGQVRDLVKKLQGLVEDGDLEGLSLALSELETTEDAQEEYTLQLEREKTLLIDKISELGREIMRASSLPSKISF